MDSILTDTDEATAERLETGYQAATHYNRYVGNIYTGSLYLSLISLLEHHDLRWANNWFIQLWFGSVGEFFSATLVEGFEQHLNHKAHQNSLDQRIELSVEQYEDFFNRFDQLQFDHSKEAASQQNQIFYLERISDN